MTEKKKKYKRRKFQYFFINNELHKVLFISKPNDLIQAWSYPRAKRVTYTYSDVIKQKEPIFKTSEVGKMLGRTHLTMRRLLMSGQIETPPFSYSLENPNARDVSTQYYWTEKNILEARDWFAHQHSGPPRKDGNITPRAIPSEREVRAMIRQESILYMRDSDGNFKPVWQAQDFS